MVYPHTPLDLRGVTRKSRGVWNLRVVTRKFTLLCSTPRCVGFHLRGVPRKFSCVTQQDQWCGVCRLRGVPRNVCFTAV